MSCKIIWPCNYLENAQQEKGEEPWVALEGEKPCATPRLRVKVERNEASHKVKVAPGYLTP